MTRSIGRDTPHVQPGGPAPGARRALIVLAAATFLSMSVWFSASFVVPQLTRLWSLTAGETSLLTIGVQVGFVVGALASAATGLSDVVSGHVLISLGALGAAASNLSLLWADGLWTAVALRILTGVFLAAVYPAALKEASTWFQQGRGKALGFMIGAVTLGSALPHLVNASGSLHWRVVIAATSALTALGSALVLLQRSSGPCPFPTSSFHISAALTAVRTRPVMLGYMGHMWELYAMWAWVAAFLASLPTIASFAHPETTASMLAFVCIGAGAAGAVVGGIISDRCGRAVSALVSLVLSGSAAVLVGVFRSAPLPVVLSLCVFWGFWVIADSAQFSALVTEEVDARYVGSAVSVQLALGYLTTTVTLWLVPVIVARASWTWALALLAIGPLAGALAMISLLRMDRSVGPANSAQPSRAAHG